MNLGGYTTQLTIVVNYTNAAEKSRTMKAAHKLLDLATRRLRRFGENNFSSMILVDIDYKEVDIGKVLRRGHGGNMRRQFSICLM